MTKAPVSPVDINVSAGNSGSNQLAEEDRVYMIQRGDILDIKFFYNPELNEQVMVRPDNKISLQLIDEVEVAGLLPSELDNILTEKYSKFLRDPQLTVIVREFSGQRIYVGGEVNAPGMISVRGDLTVLQAIFQAGGFKNTAALKNIVILRNQVNRTPLFMTLNLQEDMGNPTSHNDFFLKPYDIVFVPKTTIAKMNQFVEQYIEKLIPISLNFGFSYVYDLTPQEKNTPRF